MSFAIAIALMDRYSSGGFARWAFATDQLHRDRPGRTPMPNASLARSGGRHSITSSCLASVTFGTYCYPTWPYMAYHNQARTHLSLNKDAPIPREAQDVGRIFAKPHLRGLHHQYVLI